MNRSILISKLLFGAITTLSFTFSTLGVGCVFGIIPFALSDMFESIDIELRKLIAYICLMSIACWHAFSFLVACEWHNKKEHRGANTQQRNEI